MKIELHSERCVCNGRGSISLPGIDARALECRSPNALYIDLSSWEELGRPRTIEEMDNKRTITGIAQLLKDKLGPGASIERIVDIFKEGHR